MHAEQHRPERAKASDTWRNEQHSIKLAEKEAASIAKCPRDHEREKERRGRHWVCPALCGWTEVIRARAEEPV